VKQILSGYASTTEFGQNNLSEGLQAPPSIEFGERRINAEARLIEQSVEQLARALSLEAPVRDAAIKKALLTTTTMTSLLQLLGSVNPATSNDTKN